MQCTLIMYMLSNGYMTYYSMCKMVVSSFRCKMGTSTLIYYKDIFWPAMVNKLPLAMSLKWRRISNGTCFCTMIDEYVKPRCIAFLVNMPYGWLYDNCKHINWEHFVMFQWVLIEGVRDQPNSLYKLVFGYLRY